MLDVIKKLDSATIRGLIVATIPLLVLIGSFFGLDEALFKTQLEGIGEKIVALVSLAGVAWAAYARLFQPTPPLTETAAKKTEQMITKQGGFIRAAMLGLLLAISAPIVLTQVSGCAPFTQMSFDQKLQYSIDLATVTTNSVSTALDAGLVTKKQAAQYLDLVKQARALFDLAIELKDTDIKTAQGQLSLANEILLRLQTLVESEGS